MNSKIVPQTFYLVNIHSFNTGDFSFDAGKNASLSKIDNVQDDTFSVIPLRYMHKLLRFATLGKMKTPFRAIFSSD